MDRVRERKKEWKREEERARERGKQSEREVNGGVVGGERTKENRTASYRVEEKIWAEMLFMYKWKEKTILWIRNHFHVGFNMRYYVWIKI